MASASDETFDRIGFEATEDELVDVSYKCHVASNSYRRARRTAMLIAGGAAGLCTLGVAYPLWKGGHKFAVSVVAAIVALAVGYLAGPVHKRSTKKIVRRYVARHLHGAPTLRCDIDLRASCLWIKQGKIVRHHKWEDVIGVHDTDTGVEIVTRNTRVAV